MPTFAHSTSGFQGTSPAIISNLGLTSDTLRNSDSGNIGHLRLELLCQARAWCHKPTGQPRSRRWGCARLSAHIWPTDFMPSTSPGPDNFQHRSHTHDGLLSNERPYVGSVSFPSACTGKSLLSGATTPPLLLCAPKARDLFFVIFSRSMVFLVVQAKPHFARRSRRVFDHCKHAFNTPMGYYPDSCVSCSFWSYICIGGTGEAGNHARTQSRPATVKQPRLWTRLPRNTPLLRPYQSMAPYVCQNQGAFVKADRGSRRGRWCMYSYASPFL